MSRAIRRHHYERLKKARHLYWGRHFRDIRPMDAAMLGKVARTPHPCSGMCCGNQRRFEGRTLQEIRFLCDRP